jgi:signal transduction histidine kinase
MTFPLALLALVAAAVFGAICVAAGALWMQARAQRLLRELARDREQLLELAEAWIWRTDADLRITQWRPPAQRAAAWRDAAPIGRRLAEIALPAEVAGTALLAADCTGPHVDPDATPLARQLREHAPVAGQRVALQLGMGTSVWSLRAQPCHDGDGRFTGYVGSALPVGEAEAAEIGRAALAQLLPHSDGAVLLFERAEEAAPWRLQAHGPGALALLALDGTTAAPASAAAAASAASGSSGASTRASTVTVPLEWSTALRRLPADVAQALGEMGTGEVRQVGEWIVSWSAVGAHRDAQAGRLLVLRKAPAAPTPEPPGADAADQESFIYSVSHDLRAPIRVVEGFARILKEDYGRSLDRIGNDHTDRILAAAARMNSMIDALLALSRLQSQPLKRQPVDLSQLATYILEDLRREAPERQAEFEIEPGLVIQGDPTLMRIAIENLVGNAWKYASHVPVTRIALRREEQEGRAVYVVADNGAGFDMRFADRLFGVFQRLHSAKDFQGTGVGLASVRRIVRRHGGDIWAESEVGKGARFYFTLG